MKVIPLLSALLGSILAAGLLVAEDPPATQAVDPNHAANMAKGLDIFKKHVGPILAARCLKCHGGESTESELDLTSREKLLRGGARGAVVKPGKSSESLLYRMVAHIEEPFMPDNGAKLAETDLAAIAAWIDLGAPYEKDLGKTENAGHSWTDTKIEDARREFWSFVPLQAVEPPQIEADGWSRTPIDKFILQAAQSKGVSPNEIASRRTLLRRAFFDLTGLPPTPAEAEAFLNDPDPEAYSKLIDRLLDSPHYGERWGRHWLDLARFAESHGFEQDYDRPHAYHFRDFVIKALNMDMPYDQFVKWQIAGDELAADNPLAMMATGFLGAGVFPTQLTEKEFEPARYDELDDMVSTMGTAMLGLTIGCARCHDHKFDPIPAADYYRVAATFATTVRSEIELELTPTEAKTGVQPASTSPADSLPPAKTKVMVTSEGLKPIPHHADDRGFPHFYPDVYFLQRGDVEQKQGVATPGFLQVLNKSGVQPKIMPPPGSRTSHRRKALAEWIADPDNGAGHLLARVIVNRLWHYHFGRGIVATPSDFGYQGLRPDHPQLLEWLAGQLIQNGWHLKPIHKLMMTSAVYTQSSEFDSADSQLDPDNVSCWRFTPRRLEAEVIRDAMLAVSGELDRTQFGPGSLDEGMKRRSIYFMIKRSKLIPMMQLFDSPEPLVGVGDRPQTTIAPQSLMFLNNSQVRGYARSLARRSTSDLANFDQSIRTAYMTAIARQPSPSELQASREFVERQRDSYRADQRGEAEQLAIADLCQILIALNEFIYVE